MATIYSTRGFADLFPGGQGRHVSGAAGILEQVAQPAQEGLVHQVTLVACHTDAVFNERFHQAAEQVLAGDESTQAAEALERVIREDYAGDERFDALLEAIARYAPDEAAPDVETARLRTAIRETLGEEPTGSLPDAR